MPALSVRRGRAVAVRYTVGIGNVFGIPVRVHATFPLILLIYAADAWRTGSASDALQAALLVLAVFACVVLHELGHSLVVRRYGIAVRDIVLFPIGGVARAESIPEDPVQEIRVAVAGPAVNVVIAAILFGALTVGLIPGRAGDFFVDLAWVNVALVVFNLIPAFPMDGGRILRGVLALRAPYHTATRRARDVGQLIAVAFIVGAFVNPPFVMLSLIAVFVFTAGTLEERVVRTRVRLDGRRVGDLVESRAPVLASSDLIESALAHLGRGRVFAVAAESGSLAGVVATEDILRAVRIGRAEDTLASIARSDFPVADSATDAGRVFGHLLGERKPFAAVVDDDHFVGLFHADDTFPCRTQDRLIP